jgi:hypothetical protein
MNPFEKVVRVAGTIALCGALFACQTKSEAPPRYSVTSTAEAVDGQTPVVRKSTPEEVAAISMVEKSIADVDARFPPPSLPNPPLPLFQIEGIQADGVFSLKGGPLIKLDGVNCSENGIALITRLVSGDSVRLAFLPSVQGAPSPIPSEVWIVEDLSDGSSEHTLTASSMVVDTALVSGWCTPVRTSTTKRFDRYTALANIFRQKQAAK